MLDGRYDITPCDLNPTMLFISKGKMTRNSSYHSHDFAEITYILSGKGQYYIEGEVYNVQPGDLIMCNPGVKHHNIVTSPTEPTVECFIGFTDFSFYNMPENSIVFNDNSPILRPNSELKQKLSKLCYAMLAENDTNQVGKYFMLKARLIEIMLLLMRELVVPKDGQEGCNFESHYKNYAVNQIISYFDEHCSEKISLDRIAKNMYLSPVYISKIFKEETGESPINYLIKTRLERAKIMLESPAPINIKKIATNVGYDDAYHFSKLFKKYYGVSPLHYRKQFTTQD
ncbi:MAG: AraC family transcriptional regulator [Lachnospiraceae bacterium]|nr:AraC family transcriptional regulator [Lachnospiraceae bacterium]